MTGRCAATSASATRETSRGSGPDFRRGAGCVVDRLGHVPREQVDGELDQHGRGPAVLDLGERAAHRIDDRVGHDDLLAPLRDVLEVQNELKLGWMFVIRRG
jgi:hypothetical protein